MSQECSRYKRSCKEIGHSRVLERKDRFEMDQVLTDFRVKIVLNFLSAGETKARYCDAGMQPSMASNANLRK